MKILRKILALFPTKLPKGIQEFEEFADSIFKTYDIDSTPSYKQAIATMVMHLGPTVHRKSKHFFMRSIRKAQANQVCYEVIQQIREDDKKLKQAVTHPEGAAAFESKEPTEALVSEA